ncbi:Uncharacterised protein [Mycobacterium tuberculosis]|nr:Uncharacterised protein [Mycobacterium tuberculosis]
MSLAKNYIVRVYGGQLEDLQEVIVEDTKVEITDAGSLGFDPASSEVTRLLRRSIHERPDRLNALRQKLRGRDANSPEEPQRFSRRRRIYLKGRDECPPLGLPAARWTVDHIIKGPPIPVPSYGFDLEPVMLASLDAVRLLCIRRMLCGSVLLTAAVLAPSAMALWTLPFLSAALLVKVERWWKQAVLITSALVFARLVQAGGLTPPGLALWILPFGILVGLTSACALDRVLAIQSMGRELFPRISALPSHRRVRARAKAQFDRRLPYDDTHEHFIGAGRDVWSPAVISLPLRLKDGVTSPGRLHDGELLDAIIRKVCAPAHEMTDPLPHLSAVPVVGMPAARWLNANWSGAEQDVDPTALSGRAPSSLPDRLYLRIQTISWEGQIVVNVFVHAAFEADELRLTLRPQVDTPPYPRLRTVSQRVSRTLPLNAFLDALASLWPPKPAKARPPVDVDPVSLRDRYSLEEATDRHQNDDAKRHVTLIQRRVFEIVQHHLNEKGIATEEYTKQVDTVFNMINIYGDNNAPVQQVAAGGDASASQGDGKGGS